MAREPPTAESVPPGPSGLPLLGNARRLADDRLEFMTESAREYGDVVRMDYVGNQSWYALFHPDHVRQVLVDNNEHYIKGEFFQERLALLGEGLLNAEGEAWRAQRHQIEPAFHPERIAGYAETMVEYTQRTVDAWDPPEIRNVHSDMMGLTLEIVADALFSVDIRTAESTVGEALGTVMEHFQRRSAQPIEVPEWLPTRDNREYRAARASLEEVVADIIDQRRESGDAGDVVSMLLKAEDHTGQRMDPETISDQVMTLLLAGHETTAQSLTFTAYLLATHPAVERRLLAEIDEELGGDAPTVESLERMPYLERVVRESMRLYPPVPGLVREPTEDDDIGGYTIPKGTTVSLSQWVVHRDPRHWDNPLAFDPERWCGENDRHPFAYFPFGGGPRRCVGDRFAMLEARLVLATILQSARFETVPETRLDLSPSITLRPKDGLEMRVVGR